MNDFVLTEERIVLFVDYLRENERSELTVEKYRRDLNAFAVWLDGRAVERKLVLEYKLELTLKYKPASVNSMLAALCSLFSFFGWVQYKVRPLKIQRNLFAVPEKELARDEYKRLLLAAKLQKNDRLNLVMQTICATGIRVSELKCVTVEALAAGKAEVTGKGKRRIIFIPNELRRLLSAYVKKCGIKSGPVFVSRTGLPLSRHSVWADMKSLCADAQVDAAKVFPHNLRHLFARCFYALEKDLGRLADILGHSNINTTRIYTMESGREHERLLQRMSLVYR